MDEKIKWCCRYVTRRPWWYPRIIWGASLDGASYVLSIPLLWQFDNKYQNEILKKLNKRVRSFTSFQMFHAHTHTWCYILGTSLEQLYWYNSLVFVQNIRIPNTCEPCGTSKKLWEQRCERLMTCKPWTLLHCMDQDDMPNRDETSIAWMRKLASAALNCVS